MSSLRVKICGITQVTQGQAIAELGATALGFICVSRSPRYIAPAAIRAIVESLPATRPVDRIGVFANASLPEIIETVQIGGLTGVQLHGHEPPNFCRAVRAAIPQVELIKALRVQSAATLAQISEYSDDIDTLLLDAYHPQLLGGTGQTIDWASLQSSQFPCPWILAGGLTPDNVLEALERLHPAGIDLSSGVERSPGDKDLTQVMRLFQALQHAQAFSHKK